MIHIKLLLPVIVLLSWSGTVRCPVVESFGILVQPREYCTTCTSLSAATTTTQPLSSISDVEEKLMEIGQRLKLTVLDLDDGIYGLDSKDNRFGLEVVHSRVVVPDTPGESLGLELTEIASATDGRGLVLISDVFGAAAEAKNSPSASPYPSRPYTQLQVGDVLTGVRVEGTDFSERLTELDYDLTVEAIGRAKGVAETQRQQGMTLPVLSFEANRLVERAPITVQVVQPADETHDSSDIKVRSIDALAGENLRRLLQRKGVKVYDEKTKRFDMPFATGDCAGEGLCGTCLVKVDEGMEVLSPRDGLEELILKGRPSSYRASCKCVVGHDNKPDKVRIHTRPQHDLADEIDPGVRSVR